MENIPQGRGAPNGRIKGANAMLADDQGRCKAQSFGPNVLEDVEHKCLAQKENALERETEECPQGSRLWRT